MKPDISEIDFHSLRPAPSDAQLYILRSFGNRGFSCQFHRSSHLHSKPFSRSLVKITVKHLLPSDNHLNLHSVLFFQVVLELS